MNAEGVERWPGAGMPAGHAEPAEDDACDACDACDAFAPGEMAPPVRSHRRGMLAGLGVVGLLLAVLLLVGPGGSGPRLPAQADHGGSPVTTVAPTDGVTPVPTTLPGPPPSTTSTTSSRASEPGHVVTGPSEGSAPLHAATALPPSPTTAPTTAISTPTTTPAASPPSATSTTTTTAPPTTTTTLCILILCS